MSLSAAPTLRCRVARGEGRLASPRQNRTNWFHPSDVTRLPWNTIGFLRNAFRIVVPVRFSETSVPVTVRSCPDRG